MAARLPSTDGELGAEYAQARQAVPHVRFRALTRARFAVDAFRGIAGRPPRVDVLELGAAEGRTLQEVRRLLGVEGMTVGVEASPELVAAAAHDAGLTVIEADVTALPPGVASAQFDLVLALAVLEHLTNPAGAVREALRALRPGGVFVASCPHPGWEALSTRLGLLRGEDHRQHFWLADLDRLLRAEGFEDVRQRRFMFAPISFIPYFGVRLSAAAALAVDRAIAALPGSGFAFVNQGVIGVKPG